MRSQTCNKKDFYEMFKDMTPNMKYICEIFMNEFGDDFMEGYGARGHHHAYKGGLADHTLEVMKGAYNQIMIFTMDRTMISNTLGGAFCHDWGKIDEYYFDLKEKEILRSKMGEKEGHFGLGLAYLNDIENDLMFFEEIGTLKHILSSHHGPVSNGWGSLVDPQTPEAWIVHLADMMSSRVGGDKE